jgi:hypothetical protein
MVLVVGVGVGGLLVMLVLVVLVALLVLVLVLVVVLVVVVLVAELVVVLLVELRWALLPLWVRIGSEAEISADISSSSNITRLSASLPSPPSVGFRASKSC